MSIYDVISLLGAIATFLFGMTTMTSGLEKLSSGRLESILERLTNNLFMSVLIGALVSPICYFGVALVKKKLKIDDALDAFGCHGLGGIWGGIATGLFGMTSINDVAQWNGLVFGDVRLFLAQLAGIGVTIAVAVVGTLICAGLVRLVTPLRASEREEQLGMDVTQHGENAYPSFNGLDQ